MDASRSCPVCASRGRGGQRRLHLYQINLEEAVWMCRETIVSRGHNHYGEAVFQLRWEKGRVPKKLGTI